MSTNPETYKAILGFFQFCTNKKDQFNTEQIILCKIKTGYVNCKQSCEIQFTLALVGT